VFWDYLGHSCGHSFCQKCASARQILPQKFGFGLTPVRVCDMCSLWFVNLLNNIYDEDSRVEMEKPNVHLDKSEKNVFTTSDIIWILRL